MRSSTRCTEHGTRDPPLVPRKLQPITLVMHAAALYPGGKRAHELREQALMRDLVLFAAFRRGFFGGDM